MLHYLATKYVTLYLLKSIIQNIKSNKNEEIKV